MTSWEATLQGKAIVLELFSLDGRSTLVLDRDEADELSQRLIELVIEGDLEECDDTPLSLDDLRFDDDEDEEEDAA